jgi:hypothetical protein
MYNIFKSMKTAPVLYHHRSDYDRVMNRSQFRVPQWLALLLVGVVGAAALMAIGMLVTSIVNTPTVWFTYAGPNERGELVKVQIGSEIILAKDLTREQKNKILRGSYEIEYEDPRARK